MVSLGGHKMVSPQFHYGFAAVSDGFKRFRRHGFGAVSKPSLKPSNRQFATLTFHVAIWACAQA
jgi:hypothetical protein